MNSKTLIQAPPTRRGASFSTIFGLSVVLFTVAYCRLASTQKPVIYPQHPPYRDTALIGSLSAAQVWGLQKRVVEDNNELHYLVFRQEEMEIRLAVQGEKIRQLERRRRGR